MTGFIQYLVIAVNDTELFPLFLPTPVLGSDFLKYMEAFKPFLVIGLKNYAEYQVLLVSKHHSLLMIVPPAALSSGSSGFCIITEKASPLHPACADPAVSRGHAGHCRTLQLIRSSKGNIVASTERLFCGLNTTQTIYFKI